MLITLLNQKKLHEIENDIIEDSTAEFEMVGTLKIGENLRKTHIRF